MNKIKFLAFSLIFTCAYAWLPCDYSWAEETVEPSAVTASGNTAAEGIKRTPPSTLFSIKGTQLSGYGGFYSRYSQVGDTAGWFMGGRGCVIINDHFSFGGAGMGLVTPRDRGNLSGKEYSGIYDNVNFGYGGFLTEYYINPKSLVVFSFGTLIGGGALSFSDDSDDDDDSDHHMGTDKFFVVEPEVNVLVNITRFCRAGIGVSYRYIAGLDTSDFDKNDFSGPAVSAMVQFGWF